MRSKLILSLAHWQSMQRHVAGQAPLEACGLLAGKQAQVEVILPITNAAQSPVRYRMEPGEQIKALAWIESQGLELLGIYHSHPAGPERPSATDVEESAYPVVYLIWSPQGGQWSGRGFRIEAGKVDEVHLEVDAGK